MKPLLNALLLLFAVSTAFSQHFITVSDKLKVWCPDKVAIHGLMDQRNYLNVDTSSFRDIALGVKYSGPKVNGMPEGIGKAKYFFLDKKKSPLLVYEGEFRKGCPNGYGKMTFFIDESYIEDYYDGSFVNGYFEGEGIRVKQAYNTLLQRWEGTFHLGMLNGKGKYTRTNIGTKPYWNTLWAPSGDHTMLVNETSSYEGEWKNGLKDGKGVFKGVIGGEEPAYNNLLGRDDSYDGTWKADVPNGFGTFLYNNTNSYTGKVVDGLLTGELKAVYADSSYSIGLFNNRKELVKGALYKADTLFFDGNWLDKVPNGLGFSAGTNKIKKEAFYINGVRFGNEKPLIFRKDSIPPLNRTFYKDLKFVDLYQFGQSGDIQSVMNNTAIQTADGEFLNLASLNLVKFGGVCDYFNNVQSIGFRYDNVRQSFLWTDFLNKKESVVLNFSRLSSKMKSYTLTSDGLFLICRFDKPKVGIISALTGQILWVFNEMEYMNEQSNKRLGTRCFISPNNKYLFVMEHSSESKGGWGYGYWEITVKLTTYDLITKAVLATWDKITRTSEEPSIYFLNENQAFVSYFGGMSLNGSDIQGIQNMTIDKTDYNALGNDTYSKKDYLVEQRIFPKEPDLTGRTYFITKSGFDFAYQNNITYLQSKIGAQDISKTTGRSITYPYSDEINSKYQEATDVFQNNYRILFQDSLLMGYYRKILAGSSFVFFRIFNAPNFLAYNGWEKVMDLDPEKSSVQNATILQGAERGKKYKDFFNAITKTEFIYIADVESRTAADWMNSRSADDFKQFSKYNVFVGGTLHNNSDKTYKVKVKVIFHLIQTTSLSILSDETSENKDASAYVEVKPGETVPYLCCLSNLNSGYYIKSSTLSQRTRLADPAYHVRLEMFEGDISPEALADEDKLIRDFRSYRNIQTGKSFFDVDKNQTEFNVYYGIKEDVGEITFKVTASGSSSVQSRTSKKEYTGYKASFILNPNQNYTLTFLNKSIEPVIKPGVVQMFIDKNGGVTYEFKDK